MVALDGSIVGALDGLDGVLDDSLVGALCGDRCV